MLLLKSACMSYIKADLSKHPSWKRGHGFKRWTITLIYSELVDGGYLRPELITSKSTIHGAEQMTFTRGWPRCLITHFHKVAELTCQADTTHKQWRNNNTGNFGEKSNKTGKCSGATFDALRAPITELSRSSVGSWYFFLGEMSSATKKCMAECCAWVTEQQMCCLSWCSADLISFFFFFFFQDESPTG